jgi:hypothetical protein
MPTTPSDTESTGTSSGFSQPKLTRGELDRLVPRSAPGDWDTPSGNPLELVRYNVALDEVIARFREAKLQSQFIPQQFEMVGTDTDFDLFFEGTIIATLRFRVKAPSAVKVETPLQMPPKAERNHTPPPVDPPRYPEAPTPYVTGTDRRRKALRDVEGMVCKDRQNTYGDAEDNFDVIARRWNIYLEGRLQRGKEILPRDVAAMFADMKIARIQSSPQHMDNWLDMAGYSICGAGIVTKELEKKAVQDAIDNDPELN